MMEDDPLYRRRRLRLVEALREKGIQDERVLAAIARVPRHLFVEPALRARAYDDVALPIGLKQTISQPFTVAYQTQLLEVRPGDRVLEIGTGSGYQAAILCALGARVFTIERHRPLLERAVMRLEALGYRVVARYGDGSLGWPAFAPFDGIVVTAGATEIPTALREQLRLPENDRPGGRLVIPVGGAHQQRMMRVRCTGPGTYETEMLHLFRFVPLVRESDKMQRRQP
ncbi:MAG: protein-L-isoaspartate(D-aspartate) O-methyltransferase [Rhodothermus sp.]|nr:protein-L-isoaspartate(D-aspartate) O-methyltransferase [Rhodothermus sp.]